MRFRLCCTCDDEEKVKTIENKENNSAQSRETPNTVLPTTPPTVITQQPKNVVEPIQLDRITEVSVEESSVQAIEEEQLPIRQPIIQQSPIYEPGRQPIIQQSPIYEPRRQPIIQQSPIPEPPTPAPRNVETKHETTPPERKNEDPPMPATTKEELLNQVFNLLQAERAAKQMPAMSVETTIGDEKLTFSQIAPNLYRGFFKGTQFYIINDQLQEDCLGFDETDKAAIQLVYNRVMESMQRGVKELSGRMNEFNGQGQQVWNYSSGSTINTNYVTRSGAKAIMTFIPIGKGHFRSTYEGKEFTIVNGRLVVTDDSFDEQDRELILQTYNNTLMGMEQGLLGMQQGMLGMKMGMQAMKMSAIGGSAYAGATVQGGSVSSVAVGGNATAYASTSIGGSAYARTGIGGSAYASAIDGGVATAHSGASLATGRETLKRMRSLNHGKRISLLEGGPMAQPRQPVMVIEDITEKSKKPYYFDDVDTLAEPVLQKTTFTPQAIIYDDPKTYEKQDTNELPGPKQLDEYIISVDENFNSENRYHFHKARPRRVIRDKLNPKEKFRIASPERYSLFERECLKLHNQYRKMHGVPPLVHNEFLSQVAKEWAEHLALKDAFYHRPKNEYGENLYYVEGRSCNAKMAVSAWYDEIDLYDYDNPKFSREVGHFTQLVWKDTREVGTGVAQIGDKVWVCCNYNPPGNYLDKLNVEFVPRPLVKRVKKN